VLRNVHFDAPSARVKTMPTARTSVHAACS